MLTDPNNPYVKKPHRAELRRKKAERIPIPEMTPKGKVMTLAKYPADSYRNYVEPGLSYQTTRFIARETGVRIVENSRRYTDNYEPPVRVPPVFPYDERENPHGTVSRFDDAVKLDRAYMAAQRKRNKNRSNRN